jgi:PKD repeat protein
MKYHFLWLCFLISTIYSETKAQYVSLNYPADGFVTSSSSIELCWNYNSSNLYEIEVATDQNFNTIFFTANNLNNRKIIINNLVSNTFYFWRVRTVGPLISAWSPYRKFARFLPNSISSLGLWLRADTAVIQSNGNIITWKDLSANQYSLTQSNSANQPSLTQNFCYNNNSTKFDGNDFFIIPNYAFGIDNTVFTVVKRNGGLTQSRFIGASGNTMEITCDQTGWAQMGSIAFYDTYDPTLLSVVRASGNNAVYKNDSLIGASGAGLSPINNASLIIGWSTFQNPVDFLVGEIAEIIVYSTLLNDSLIGVVNRYLMDKYSDKLDLGADTIINDNFCPVTLSSPYPFQQYLWSTGETTPTISVNVSGTYWLKAKDYFGRTFYDSIHVQYPAFNQISSQPICAGTQLNWNTGLGSSFNYLWQDNSTQSNLAISNAGNYYVKVTDSQGCSFYSDTINISIDNFSFSTSLGVDTNLCIGNTLQLQNITSPITNYFWSNASTNDSLAVTASGSYWVEAINFNNCVLRDTINITIVGTAPQSVFSSSNGCIGAPVTFNDLSTPPLGESIASWDWNFGDGQSSNLQNVSHTYDSAGVYVASLKILLLSGCGGISNQIVTVFKKPQLSITAQYLCNEKNAVFSNQSNLFGGTLDYIHWDFGDPFDTISSNTSPAYHNFNNVGNYNVALTITTAEGCVDSLNTNIQIKPSPVANFSNINLCIGDTTLFTDISQIAFPWENILRIWKFPNADTSMKFQPTYTFDTAGVYSVKLIVQASNGCIDTISKSVVISNVPLAQFSLDKACTGDVTNFNNMSTCNNCIITSNEWLLNNNFINNTNNISYTFSDTGLYLMSLKVYNTAGCKARYDTTIMVSSPPKAEFSMLSGFGSPPFQPIFYNESVNASNYLWEFGNGFTSTEENPNYVYQDTGSYVITLHAFNASHCVSSYSQPILIAPKKVDLMIFSIDAKTIDNFITTEMLVFNNGTSVINSFDAIIQNFNNVTTKEEFSFRLIPGEFKSFSLSTKLKQDEGLDQSDIICVTLNNIDAGADEFPDNNKRCVLIDEEPVKILNIYPIPAADKINVNIISAKSGVMFIKIKDLTGKLMFETTVNAVSGLNQFSLPLNELAQGVYILSVDINGAVINAKVLVSNIK